MAQKKQLLMEEIAFKESKINQEQLNWLKEYRKILSKELVGPKADGVELEMEAGLQGLKNAEKHGLTVLTPQQTANYALM